MADGPHDALDHSMSAFRRVLWALGLATLGCADRPSVGESTADASVGSGETASADGEDAGASSASSADSETGVDPADCGVPGDAAEVLACDVRPARALDVEGSRVYWVSGSTSPTCEGHTCGAPRVYAAPLTGGGVETVMELDRHSLHIAVGASIVVAPGDSVVEIDENGEVHTLDAQGAKALAELDDTAYWVGANDSTIWSVDLPRGWEAEKRALGTTGDFVYGLAVTSEFVVWASRSASDDGRTISLLRLDGSETIVMPGDAGAVDALVATPDHVHWSTLDGTISSWEVGTDSAPSLLVEIGDAFVPSLAARNGTIYYSVAPYDGSNAVYRLDPGGSPVLLVTYDDSLVPVSPDNLAVHGDFLYWIDVRLMRLPVQP